MAATNGSFVSDEENKLLHNKLSNFYCKKSIVTSKLADELLRTFLDLRITIIVSKLHSIFIYYRVFKINESTYKFRGNDL